MHVCILKLQFSYSFASSQVFSANTCFVYSSSKKFTTTEFSDRNVSFASTPSSWLIDKYANDSVKLHVSGAASLSSETFHGLLIKLL